MNLPPHGSDDRSGFSERVPWVLTWIIALSLFLVGLVSAESAWRSLGYRPLVVDSPALWKFWYERAAIGRTNTIVLIGASRIQAGISTHRMRERLPGFRVVQLGQYAGNSPVGVLGALASDERFNGIVICDMLAAFLIRERWESQHAMYQASVTARGQIDAYRIARASDLLAINNSGTGIAAGLKQWVARGRFPAPNHVRMRADRSIEIDFGLMEDLQGHRERSASRFRSQYESAEHPSPECLDDELREIDGFVRRIQDRGGQVVFVRMPSSGERAEIEELYHPEAEYWDRFATSSSGVCIHWTELEGATSLICPDDSHLNHLDAITLTHVLVNVLVERGVFMP